MIRSVGAKVAVCSIAVVIASGCALVDGIGGSADVDAGPSGNVDAGRGIDAGPGTNLCVADGRCYAHMLHAIPEVNAPEVLAVLDYDGDELLDIAVCGETGLAVVENMGGGQFEAHGLTTGPCVDVSVGALDSELGGDLVAVIDGQALAYFGRSDHTAMAATETPIANARRVVVVDTDGTGLDEVVMGDGGVTAMVFADGTGGFMAPTVVPNTLGLVEELIALDSDGDSVGDFAIREGGTIALMESDGAGGFAEQIALNDVADAMVAYPVAAISADAIVAARSCKGCGATDDILAMRATTGLAVDVPYGGPGPFSTTSVEVGFVDGDNVPDLILANRDSDGLDPPGLFVLTGFDGAKFTGQARLSIDAMPTDVVAAKLNTDDIDDLVVAYPNAGTIGILLSE